MSASHHGSKTPIAIILITAIILVGALIGIFFPHGPIAQKGIKPLILNDNPVVAPQSLPTDSRYTGAYYQKINGDVTTCGIKIFSPLVGEKVSFPLEISGYVNGCGWIPWNNGTAVTMEVRDNSGALAPLIIVPVEDINSFTLPAYFKSRINTTKKPSSPDGVIIFHNSVGDSFQIPILFGTYTSK